MNYIIKKFFSMKRIILILLTLLCANGFAQLPDQLSKAEKIYGLSKFWQEVNYNFVYLDKVDREAWDREYQKLITEVQETPNDYEYYKLLQKFCALLKDGHTNVYPNKEIWDMLHKNFTTHNLIMSRIEGKPVITGINESKKEDLPIGTQVVEVNGLPVEQYLAEFISPYISSSTDYVLQEWAVKDMFRAPAGTKFDVLFKLPQGEQKKMQFTVADKPSEEPVFPPAKEKKLLDLRWVKQDEIAYVALNSFADEKIGEEFRAVLPEIYKAKKLIIDLRENGGGNTGIGRDILEFLTTDTLLYGSRSQTRLHIPTLKAWGEWTKEKDTMGNEEARRTYLAHRDALTHFFPYEPDTVKPGKKKHIVPTALLLSHNTASAAEDFLIYADGQPHMIKIGEASFGSTGQPYHFAMVGGGFARVCTKKDTYPDGREFVGVGIQPNLEVKKSLQDYLENRDPVLEAAVKQLKGKERIK